MLSNPVILTYLWEQSCILHTITKLPACNLSRTKKCLQCLKTMCLYNSFGVGRLSFWQSWLTWANSRLQFWMLGCQLSQTCLSLIAHTWPWFDPSRSCTPCEPPAQSSRGLVWAWGIEYFECNLYVNTVNMS